jgi:hypothetical protein
MRSQITPLVKDNDKITTYQLDAESGFEGFSKQVHRFQKKCISAIMSLTAFRPLSAWATT